MSSLPYTYRLTPGKPLGIVGGGQLGRMFCHAAQRMGYSVTVLESFSGSPAGSVAEREVIAQYDDEQGLIQLLQHTQAVTTEFENVPASSLKFLSQKARVSPSAAAVAVAQDRLAEKAFIASQGVAVAPYAEIRRLDDIQHVSLNLFPGILKVARLGYDGKGQARVKTPEEAMQAFKQFGEVACVLEKMLPLEQEVSVIVVRSFDDEVLTYPLGVNTHINSILSSSEVGFETIPLAVQTQAREAAIKLAEGLNYRGVMCVEFFVLAGQQVIVNEIAPRPHNSGHYTMNACFSSQFEQQVRVLAAMPLGSTELLAPTIMLNILGDSWFVNSDTPLEPAWDKVLALPGVHLHLYGKTQARRGRKMGHVNIVNANPDKVRDYARQVSHMLHLHAQI